MKRWCPKCQFEKPAEGFVCRASGKFGRNTVCICGDCNTRRKAAKTVAQRDAFGAEVRKNNGTRAYTPKVPSFRREEL